MIKRWPFTIWALFALGLSFGMWSTKAFGQRNLFHDLMAPWEGIWAFMFWLPEHLLDVASWSVRHRGLLVVCCGVVLCVGLDLVARGAMRVFNRIAGGASE